MPAGNAHRILNTLFEAFSASIGPGILPDPGDAGTIRPNKNFQICEMVSAAAETRTLANPDRPGIRFILRLLTDGGDVTVTASNGFDENQATVATFADKGDMLSLVSVQHTAGTHRWEVLEGNVGSVTTLVSSSPSSSVSSSPSSSVSSSVSSSPSSSVSSSPSSSVSSSPSSSPSAT